jgi:phosphoribosylpyrophosphate synthetase
MRDLSLSRSQLLLLAGTANRPLAEEMAQHLGQPLCAVTMRRFADGEIFVKIDENVRGRDVFIIQPTNPPAENYMELLLLMDAAHGSRRCCPTSGTRARTGRISRAWRSAPS